MTPALPTSSPAWPRLAGLTLCVLAAHGVILVAAPLRLAAIKTDSAVAARTFVTRSITPTPKPVAPEPEVPKPQPKPTSPPKPVRKPKIVPKELVASIDPAPVATHFIASELPVPVPTPAPALSENLAPDASPLPIASASSPESDTPTAVVTDAAPASVATPVAAASAPAPGPPPAALPTVVSDISLPASATLAYKMTGTSKGLQYYANAELIWRNTGTDYEAGMRVSAFLLGSRSMSSVGRVTPNGLAPTRFSDKSRTEVAAHFETDKGKVSFSANTPDAPLLLGAQDRVSVFFQLGGILAAGAGQQPPVGVGSSITVYTVGPRDADTWTFTVDGEELLNLPAGDMATLRLTRKPRREFDQKIEIWYAPALGYLPVRNRITQANGDFVDQQLSSVEKP